MPSLQPAAATPNPQAGASESAARRLGRIVPEQRAAPATPVEDEAPHSLPPRAIRTVNPPPMQMKPERRVQASAATERPPALGRLGAAAKKASPAKEVEKPPTPLELEALLVLKEKQLEHSDFYTLLDLDHGASSDEVKQAYFKLAKRFHPDRFLSTELRSLRRRAEAVFERISEAHDTLRDDEKRIEYQALLSDERVKGDRRRAQTVAQADGHFARARELMTQGEWSLAEDALHRAIGLFSTDPDYHAALGWAVYQNPETPVRVRRSNAIKPLLKALQIKPNHERSHLTLARIYELEGLLEEAARHYQKVLEVNDRNTDAAQALVRLRAGMPAR